MSDERPIGDNGPLCRSRDEYDMCQKALGHKDKQHKNYDSGKVW